MASIDSYYFCHLHVDETHESRLLNSLSIPSTFHINLHFNPLLEYLTGTNHAKFSSDLDRIILADESIRASIIRDAILDTMPLAQPCFIAQVVPLVSSFIVQVASQPCNRNRTLLSISLFIDLIVLLDDEIESELFDGILRRSMEDMNLGFEPASKDCIDGLEKVRVEDSDEVGDCSICLEKHSVGEEAVRLTCKHVFHGNCIIQWLQTSHVCPLCRFAMPVD